MKPTTNKIYARPQNGLVIKFFSSVFEQPQGGNVLVEEGNEDYHAHVHLKYQVLDENFCHNYKVVGSEIFLTTEKEKAAELANKPTVIPPPTPEQQRISALETALALQQQVTDSLLISALEV